MLHRSPRLVALLGIAAVALPTLVAPSQAEAQAGPPSGAYFRYGLVRTVHDGRATYAGYADELTASGRYDVTAVTADRVTLHAAYAWRFDSSDRRDRGEEVRTVTFGLPSRRYEGPQTDLDDYDASEATSLATWCWIPPETAVGSSVALLEREFVVVGVSEAVTAAGGQRTAIHLRTAGAGRRDDDYGHFTTTFTDEYWFDSLTGMFLREAYEEHDVGTFEGQAAEFDVTERVTVSDASYAPSIGPLPLDPVEVAAREDSSEVDAVPSVRRAILGLLVGLVPFGVGIVALYVLYLVLSRLSGGGRGRVTGPQIDVSTVLVGSLLPDIPPEVTAHFRPFLAHFATLANRTNNDALVARIAGQVVGVAFSDRDTGVATILAPKSDVAERLRAQLGTTEFFSELRHGNLESVLAATSQTGEKLPSSHAYNVYETYEVLRLDPLPPDLGFDTNVVSRLEESHAPAASALLDSILGVPCHAFLVASLALGDLAYVARVDGQIVGVALATLSGTTGRLHTLAVHPDHRARGIGKELVRARLRALADLGATSVITEIATWNLASLEIARSHGFKKVSEMFVESSREARVEKRLVRR